ncbi:uncharacterized protein NFIA_041190 [Aspergillus fischeri NRRL 181]|uniref:Uncharacterized protein n=1 Tax=Neosartorya fischeri (strain ATCC 1020 / DSM 3700 / CBS 544.65 / FGSC A1164 / JCM 1740 / NRRL 181 / WB 181) TaxID=331117 RepID=A1D0M1_NEOFI|nr:uncharacterized protein NFIA_041190 [Aspergillus fischeri NRRL 181]EAW24541.1 hypothetical protein NFIA_041190 [Aspergillus fischeri NRRL 181]
MSSNETTTIVRPLSPSATETSIPEHDPEATLLEMGDMVQDMAPEEDSQAILLEMEDTARDIVPEQDFGVLLLQMEDMVQDMSNTLLEAATMQETKSLLDAVIGLQKTGADTVKDISRGR